MDTTTATALTRPTAGDIVVAIEGLFAALIVLLLIL